MKFTKTYKVEMNERQKESLKVAFKTLAEYFLNEEKAEVEVVVDKFDESRISADLIVNGKVFDSKLIGKRGGLTCV